MPGTPATRRGNGAGKGDGWGGPAKGPGNHGPSAGYIKPELLEAIQADKARRLEILKDHILSLALTAERQETQLQAAIAYCNREEGTPVARQDVTTQGQRIGYVIPAPPEAENAEAWTEQYKPR